MLNEILKIKLLKQRRLWSGISSEIFNEKVLNKKKEQFFLWKPTKFAYIFSVLIRIFSNMNISGGESKNLNAHWFDIWLSPVSKLGYNRYCRNEEQFN